MRETAPRKRLEPAELASLATRAGAGLAAVDGLAAVWLHGSAARGEPARDLDVAVLALEGARPWDVARAVAALLDGLQPPLPWPPLPWPPLPWDIRPVTRDATPRYRYNVVHDGLLLAEPRPDVRASFEFEAVRDYLDIRPFLDRANRRYLEAVARGA